MFDEISCEEFYGEDYMFDLREILEEAANFQLQEIADELKESQVLVEMDALYFGV